MKVSILLITILALSGCKGVDPPAPAASRRAARLSTTEHLASPDLRLSDGKIIVRAGWGSGPGQLGKLDEASRPGPMDLAVADDGTLHVLDQVNRRIQRFTPAGASWPPLPLSAQTAEYIALSNQGVWVLSYERQSAGHILELVGRSGVHKRQALAAGTDLITGLFSDGEQVWIEQRHDRLTKVWPVKKAGQAVLGRPNRGEPGQHLLAARDAEGGVLLAGVIPMEGTFPMVTFKPADGAEIVAIEGLRSDKAGRVYLALKLADRITSPGQDWVDVRRVCVVYRPGARPIIVEMAAELATDMNNYLAVGPGGGLFQLHTTEAGVLIRRWHIPSVEVRP